MNDCERLGHDVRTWLGVTFCQTCREQRRPALRDQEPYIPTEDERRKLAVLRGYWAPRGKEHR